MNPQELPRKLAQRLDEGLDAIPSALVVRLRSARDAALARAQTGEAVVGRFSTGVFGGVLGGGPGRVPPGRRLLAPALGLVFALLAMLYWQQAQRLQQGGADNADIDAEVLAEELPVSAYLDQGFEVWLYHHSPPASAQP